MGFNARHLFFNAIYTEKKLYGKKNKRKSYRNQSKNSKLIVRKRKKKIRTQ